jgi:hypothetical protein
MGQERNVYRVLVEKPEGKRPLLVRVPRLENPKFNELLKVRTFLPKTETQPVTETS